MKEKLLTIFTVLLIGVLLVLLQSCKDDNVAPDDMEIFKDKIARTWKVKRVSVDEVDVTSAFKNMTITFNSDLSYKVANSVAPIWPAGGSFEIIPASSGQYDIRRSDGVAMTTSSPTDSGIILEFIYNKSSARVTEVSGKYRFELGL